VSTGESGGEPEQLRRGSVRKATGRVRETTRPKLMAVLRLPIGMTGCVIVLRSVEGHTRSARAGTTLTSETGQSIPFHPFQHKQDSAGLIPSRAYEPTHRPTDEIRSVEGPDANRGGAPKEPPLCCPTAPGAD